ncbi:MAG: hypothetical protein ACPHLK_10370 [Gammaproteobacteria bacterium]|jgi:hypothetical protein
MAKLSRKAELALWWNEYQTKIVWLSIVFLTIIIIIAGFYPLSSETVMGEVKTVSPENKTTGMAATTTIYSSITGEVGMVVPTGVTLNIGDKVEISRGKTMFGLYRYVFVKKIPSSKQPN